jgi:hypothetical protein
MLNLYQYHTNPSTLVQRGLPAKLAEVFSYMLMYLEHYAERFNEDPDDNGDSVTIKTSDESDMYRIELVFKHKGSSTYSKVTFILLLRETDIAIAGRNSSIYEARPYTQNLRVYEDGTFDHDAVDDFIDDILHH